MRKIAKKLLKPLLKELLDLHETGYDTDTLLSVMQDRLEKLDAPKS